MEENTKTPLLKRSRFLDTVVHEVFPENESIGLEPEWRNDSEWTSIQTVRGLGFGATTSARVKP